MLLRQFVQPLANAPLLVVDPCFIPLCRARLVDAQGFGIIDSADSSKVPFLRSDVNRHRDLELGQKVVFSLRRVNDYAFAENVTIVRDRLNAL